MKAKQFKLNVGYSLLAVVVIIMALLPVIGVRWYVLHVLFVFFVYLALANMWNLLAGYSGLVSLGQPAFMGIAGYTVAMLLWFYNIPLYLATLAACVVATLFAAILSIPLFRMRGLYFSIGTLLLNEICRVWFNWWRPIPVPGAPVGGGAGFGIVSGLSPTSLYYLALAVGIVSILLMRFILKSKLGAGLMAIRDNEKAAATCGINVFRCKLYSFLIATFFTGLASCVFYFFQGHIEPKGAFSITWLNVMLMAVIIGGISTEEGPIVGTAIVVLLEQILPGYAQYSPLILGILLVIVITVTPPGIIGLLRKTRTYDTLLRYLSSTWTKSGDK
ncbi:MAG: branched-chain amino acid ABC transporter permease [Candidatus Bathyarchaeia archaeon]